MTSNASQKMRNLPIGVHTTEKLGLQVHVVEVIDDLIPVGLVKKEKKVNKPEDAFISAKVLLQFRSR